MRGYKAFDENLKCRNFQYEIGQTYEIDGEIEICERGFHFCKDLADCYRFYGRSGDTRICEVESLGEIKTDDNIKYCTNKIKILSEVENPRIKTNVCTSSSGYCNSGAENSGYRNSGDYNSGNMNSGNHNSGSRNSGEYNCGNRNSGIYNVGSYNSGDGNIGGNNSGSRNSGHGNSGHCNSGNMNTGHYNTGYRNSGDWNIGNHNSGVFNCDTNPKIRMFDQESDWTIKDWYRSKAFQVMYACPCTYSDYDMDQEKIIVREATTEDIQKWWDELSEDDKNAVKSLPNFNADKFYSCTGIRV